MAITRDTGRLRIGELSRRQSVSPDVLRVWERRYGLLRPERTEGGFRLYTHEDEERVRAMRRYLSRGFSAAVAARMALEEPAAPTPGEREDAFAVARAELGEALEDFRDVDAQTILDRVFNTFSVEAALRDVILPYLRDLGSRWETGDISTAQEHFASFVLRGRLLGIARGFDVGLGPRALLACPEGERHDMGLLCFGIGLRDHGWRITYLGADCPLTTVADAAAHVSPDLVVICAELDEPMRDAVPHIAVIARRFRVALCGRGASLDAARATGAQLLQDAPMAAAARIAYER
ncbi:MAG TPA: MerR family transcriptional regulator [Miltoncostaeaceae bacterium]|nr:MerR family transcriptional regulator [Miltoncostaeaceae bacterium]